MRLGVLVAILGELPDLRDQLCAPREKPPRREIAPRADHQQPSASRAQRVVTQPV